MRPPLSRTTIDSMRQIARSRFLANQPTLRFEPEVVFDIGFTSAVQALHDLGLFQVVEQHRE
jgi:hypothetical protein